MQTFNLFLRFIVRLVAGATWLASLVVLAIQSSHAVQSQPSPILPAPPPVIQPAEEVNSAELVAEIRILGNDTVPTSKIASQLSTRVGRPFDRSVVTHDVYKLANLGWFVDVKPLYEATPQGRIVFFQVVERPTIRYVTYLGNKKLSDKKLNKQTNLKVGGSIDPYAVEEGRRKILEQYQSSGYSNAQVTILEGTKATDQGIVYLIHEGPSRKIGKIRFIGNEFVSGRRLKTLIQSKPPLLKLFKGYVNQDQIASDVDQLTAYYRSFGFFQARVGRKLDYNAQGDRADLTFVIHEGPRYKVRNVRFLGNTKFEPAALAATAKLTSGHEFEQAKMRQDTLWLQELYGSHGYVFADVKPETIFLEEPGEVDLVYHIEEGSQWRVGRILVQIGGENPHTRIQTALNRISLRSGDIMDIRELKASERRLQASSLFHSDPATGVRPKITYRIPEDSQMGLARAQGSGIRGQSPDTPLPLPVALGPPVLLPPVSGGPVVADRTCSSPSWSTRQQAQPDRRMDVIVQCPDLEQFHRWQQGVGVERSAESSESPSEEKGSLSHQDSPQGSHPSEITIRGQSPPPVAGQTQAWWAPSGSAPASLPPAAGPAPARQPLSH